MPAPRKYPEELRERAIRLAMDARKDPATGAGALWRIGEHLRINSGTLRGWVSQTEIDARQALGTTSADATRLASWRRRTASFAGRTASGARELVKFSV